MSDTGGEKSEQPTAKKLDEAIKRGQTARSAEVQTVFVLLGGLAALTFTGRDTWQQFVNTTVLTFGHLHDTTLTSSALQGYAINGTLVFLRCAGPVVLATALCGLLAGAIQNKFQTASEALTPDWNRLNPVEGFKRTFSTRSLPTTGMAIAKLLLIIALTYSQVVKVLNDPIFASSVSVPRIGQFLASVCLQIFLRVSLCLIVIAAADYGYQWWRTNKDLMMTKEEVKEEMKSTEGNPRVKAARRRRRAQSKAKMLAEIPKADVVVVNPTHIAVALRYDRKTMRAPKIVAKGIRLNAQKIREIAEQHQVPILQNVPLARSLFKHGRIGGEVPAQFYTAVAEVLAWVYRVNRYRYYTQQA
ncbi:MAG TPA: EscU/YscU/HrcU family type III secretion system export apparatus switch protein [Candidatus Angelobacter sp.]|nr:EscU/YscU/HrcU family type III secretion system export apparatus switch protein [Candidatus Angelobacter sp.]